MRKVLVLSVVATFLVSTFAAAVVAGYYVHAWSVTPLARLIPRIERKIDDVRGAPSPLESDVALLETTFLQLRGEVMRPPGIGWINGGALTVRGDRLIIMDRLGRLYDTDGEAPVRRIEGIEAPDNGLGAYMAFADTEEGKQYRHNFNRMRFNDVTWIDGALSGLAVSYTFFEPERVCYGTRVSLLEIDREAPLESLNMSGTDWNTIFETQPCLSLIVGREAISGHMAGGRMAFQAPSTLYLGSGDYHLDGIAMADIGIQSDDTSYGKIVAIDLSGDFESRIVSKGHRNLQGVTLDGQGRLWTVEHGIRGGDELNLIRDGGNFGWPKTTLGTLYSGQPAPGITYGHHDVGISPVYAWLPSAAVSSLMTIDGLDPAWDGDLLAGSLSSPEFGQSLWRIRIEDERVVFVERIRLGHRVRYLTQFGDRIAALLDSNDVVLFSASRREDQLAGLQRHLKAMLSLEMQDYVLSTLNGCNECHSFAEGEQLAGPSLNGVVGRPVASTGFTGYSDALSSVSGQWTPDRLAAFLADPNSVAPGTTMPSSGLEPGPELDALVDALAMIDSSAGQDLTYD